MVRRVGASHFRVWGQVLLGAGGGVWQGVGVAGVAKWQTQGT